MRRESSITLASRKASMITRMILVKVPAEKSAQAEWLWRKTTTRYSLSGQAVKASRF